MDVLNKGDDLGGNSKKKEEEFSMQRLFSVSNFLVIITFRSSLRWGEATYNFKRSCAISEGNCQPGWEAYQLHGAAPRLSPLLCCL